MTTTTVLNQRYELRNRLYSEGNQAAYEALDHIRQELVLVVLIPPAAKLGPEVDRAVRASIDHAFEVSAPSLIPLADVQEDRDYRFLVMPMPHAENAWTHITKKAKKDRAARLSPDQLRNAADDLIAAAKAAHAHKTTLGFSPHQVWIDDHGHAQVQYYWLERVRLAAQATDGKRARFQTMAVEGAHFQAPELSKGREGAAPPADQFFISAILYGLLTGQVPGGSLTPVRTARPDVPKPMAQAIERGLQREPRQRHADLDQLRRALHRRPAKLTFLLPLFLLLATLWVGYALAQGGARADDWAFAAEMADRRDAAYAATRPEPRPVQKPEPAMVQKFAGAWSNLNADGRGHVLTLFPDGRYRHRVTRGAETDRDFHGLWWTHSGGRRLSLAPPGRTSDDLGGPPDAIFSDGRIDVTGVEHVSLTKVAWFGGEEGTLRPLVRLREPLDDVVLGRAEVRVVGDVAVGGCKVEIDGQDVPVLGTKFTTVWKPQGRGPLQLVVKATTADGFTQTTTRRVHVDASAPRIEGEARLMQTDGIWQLDVSGRITDDGTVVACTVNDEPVELQADGSFTFTRRGADAEGHAFAEVVAVDDAGRAARQLLWAKVIPIDGSALSERFETARQALEDGRTGEAEELLRRLRADGGLIEQLDPEQVTMLVRSGRPPRISLDDYPLPPSWIPNDGTQTVELSGEVDWFAPGDRLTVAGIEAAVSDGRFSAKTQLPQLGKNIVRIQVLRGDTTVAQRDVELWIASADGDVPTWTGVPVTDAQRAASARFGLPIGHQNEQGMRFVLVPPGAFSRRTDDGRPFEVRVTKPYYMQIREVTRTAFERSSARPLPKGYVFPGGTLPIDGPDRPAAGVKRAEAIQFAQRLTAGGKGVYRLPTEAEWELAARAGDGYGERYWGNARGEVGAWANFADRAILSVLSRWPKTRLNMEVDDGHAGPWPVGSKRANAYGLRDMLGNVAEWVADFYGAYDSAAGEDPVGPSAGTHGIVRGGSFRKLDTEYGFASRERVAADADDHDIGFRLVYVPGAR